MKAAGHPKLTKKQRPKPNMSAADVRSGAIMDRAALDAWGAEAQSHVTQLVERVVVIERELSKVAKLIRISSPPVAGKVDVRWWNYNGITRPVLVRWIRQKGGRLRPKKIERLVAARRLGTSAINADASAALAKIARRLILERTKTVQRLVHIAKYTGIYLRGQQGLMGLIGGEVNLHGQEILRKLVRRGYSVEAKYIELVGAKEWFDAKEIGLDDDARVAGGFALIEADDRID